MRSLLLALVVVVVILAATGCSERLPPPPSSPPPSFMWANGKDAAITKLRQRYSDEEISQWSGDRFLREMEFAKTEE